MVYVEGSAQFGANPLLLIATGVTGILTFTGLDLVWARIARKATAEDLDARVWIVLHAVLISGFGLMVLVHREIGWPAFLAMVLLFALTKREFDRYAQAKSTLEQTVQALSKLELRSL